MQDATELLTLEQNSLLNLFEKYHVTRGRAKKMLVEKIFQQISLYLRIEEDVFYPAISQALQKTIVLPDIAITFKKLIMMAFDAIYNKTKAVQALTMTELSDYLVWYFKQLREKIFPLARQTNLDLHALGAKILQRKLELTT